MSDFDVAVQNYDKQFTHSIVGLEQRKQVWKCIEKLKIAPSSTVLEINGGTGEDAYRWSQLGHRIHSTDISAEMVKRAGEKFPELHFTPLDFKDIQTHNGTYDIVFSNFGGLNCASPEELKRFMSDVATKLNPNGQLIMIIMGKKCWWDRWYMKRKTGSKETSHRRNTSAPVEVMVDGVSVKTWYYAPHDIKAFASNHFTLQKVRPIGLFVPPSYLAPYFEKKKTIFSILSGLDRGLGLPFWSNQADHYFISFTKKHS